MIDPDALLLVINRIDAELIARASPVIVGLCGAQGSGKTTWARAIASHYRQRGVRTGVLSIDDLYLTKRERLALAADVHPLLATRGPPGTHDIELGKRVFTDIRAGRTAILPRFDKALDDRCPESLWDISPAGSRLLIFEGWCVGAVPQSDDALVTPVNALEGIEDPAGIWRRYCNDALSGDYQALFAGIDLMLLLKAPSFKTVLSWRTQQEHEIRKATLGGMTDAAIIRFIDHYERLTRHILAEMPDRADMTLSLDTSRRVEGIRRKQLARRKAQLSRTPI